MPECPYWHLQSCIYIFVSGHAANRGPRVKGQAGLRYHCDCMPPYGWAGRQAEDLNPCLEQSRSQAAGKLSSVPPSASPPPSLTPRRSGLMPCNSGHNCFVLYLFLLLLSELEATKWNEVTHEESASSFCQGAQWFLSHVQKQMSHWLQSEKFLLVYLAVLFPHPHTSGSLVQVNCFHSDAMQEVADAACRLNMLFSLC